MLFMIQQQAIIILQWTRKLIKIVTRKVANENSQLFGLNHRMNIKWQITILGMVITQSCSFIHFMGTKDAIEKNETDVYNYLQKEKFSFYDFSFLLPKENVDSLSSINHVLDLWKYGKEVEQSTIQLRIYDSIGRLVNGYAQCYGEMNRVNILSEETFKHFKQFPNNYDLIFSNELKLWNIPLNQQLSIQEQSIRKKYTFVIYWNIWSNYYSKVIFRNLKKYLNKYNMRENSLIIFVNTD